MSVAIIDYGSGNLRSVAKAFEHVAPSENIRVTSLASDLIRASHIVLPGVGAFGDCMYGLAALSGMLEVLHEQVIAKQKNFLGICVGMQMMFERGLEHGAHNGLGWLKGEVVKIEAPGHKIPHMGWNELDITQPHTITKDIKTGDHAYFVHSYYAEAEAADILATTHYGSDIAVVVGRNNMVGTQFHPEKSQKAGLAILQNFLTM